MKYLKLFEDFNEADNQFSSRIEDDMQLSNELGMENDIETDMGDEDSKCKNCNCQCDSCVCTSDGCQCTNCQCTDTQDLEDDSEFSDDEMITDDTMDDEEVEDDATHLSKFGEFNEAKKMNAGFKAYLDKKKSKSDKKKDEPTDKKDSKKKGLTAGQKKLPEAMQKAILKKQK